MKTPLTFLFAAATCLSIHAGGFEECFIPGEVSEYKVSWMGIPLAWSKTTTDTITEDGRELVRIRMESQTYAAYAHLYPVDDVTEVVIDPATALPLRLDLTLNEGSRHKSHLTTFNHKQGVAIFQDRLTKDFREVPIASDTKDVVTFLYSIRNQTWETLAAKKHKLFVDGEMHELGIETNETKNVDLPAYGKVPCTAIEPIAQFNGLFLRQGKIMFWVSTQNRRMVTCVQAKIPVGKITVKLQDVSGPGDDFWIKNKQ